MMDYSMHILLVGIVAGIALGIGVTLLLGGNQMLTQMNSPFRMTPEQYFGTSY